MMFLEPTGLEVYCDLVGAPWVECSELISFQEPSGLRANVT
jgi:hypothetical protein